MTRPMTWQPGALAQELRLGARCEGRWVGVEQAEAAGGVWLALDVPFPLQHLQQLVHAVGRPDAEGVASLLQGGRLVVRP